MNRRRVGGWAVVGAFFAVLLMVVSGVPFVASVTPVVGSRADTSPLGATGIPGVGEVGTLTPGLNPAFTIGAQYCTLVYGVFSLGTLTLACQVFQQQFDQLKGATEKAIAQDLIISAYNQLNQTASTTAIENATSQELVSYFANRAEAVVPYFLNQSWSPLVSDKIASYSGLAASLQGMKSALGEQEYQDWNATVTGYQGQFGTGMAYSVGGYNMFVGNPSVNPQGGSAMLLYNQANANTSVSMPWEVWSGYYDAGGTNTGSSTIYFNMEPGGTVVDANINNGSGYWYGNWTVTDMNTGQTVPVSDVSYVDWTHQTLSTIPVLTKQYPFGQFDLMKATCVSGCSMSGTRSPFIETSGAYAFENTSTGPLANEEALNSMNPHIFVGQYGQRGASNNYAAFRTSWSFPSSIEGVCLNYTGSYISGSCNPPSNGTGMAASEGFASQMSGGPGQVVGGNDTLTQFGASLQTIMNNTMTLAQAYWAVLRAATDNGTYAIPADCSIPFPSNAFPAATNPSLYHLSLANTEVTYLAYLESVARWYGTTFTNTVGFCNDPHLGLTFNWSSTWKLHTNITASVYLGAPNGAVTANGSVDGSSLLGSPSTWPIQNVDPTLFYPYEFQMNVPVGQAYPIPFNDPIAGVMVNYTGNPLYGSPSLHPAWGIPTYLQLSGFGNLIEVSGGLSGQSSQGVNSTGDAIDITSCVIGGVQETICPLSVTYFDNFTFGAIHAFVNITCTEAGTCPGGGGGAAGYGRLAQAVCGTGAMNQWYDAWAGNVVTGVASVFIYIGQGASTVPVVGGGLQAFFTDMGCLIGYIVLVLVFIGLFILVAWVIRVWRG